MRGKLTGEWMIVDGEVLVELGWLPPQTGSTWFSAKAMIIKGQRCASQVFKVLPPEIQADLMLGLVD